MYPNRPEGGNPFQPQQVPGAKPVARPVMPAQAAPVQGVPGIPMPMPMPGAPAQSAPYPGAYPGMPAQGMPYPGAPAQPMPYQGMPGQAYPAQAYQGMPGQAVPGAAVPGAPVSAQPARPGQPAARAVPARAAVAVPVGQGPPGAVRAKTKEELAEERDLAEEAVKKAPPWLISAVIHLVLVIALALWLIPFDSKEEVRLEGAWAPVEGEQLENDTFTVEVKEPDNSADSAITDAQPVADPMAAVAKQDTRVFENGTQAVSDVNAPAIGSLLKGRQVGLKKALMAKYGGSPDGEKAVALALAWLAKQQDKHTGGWKLKGPYEGGSSVENSIAATSMALLAFQGYGVTHQTGQYKENVTKGWEYLLHEQKKGGEDDGNFYNGEGPYNHHIYTHSQATIAICEIYGMTRDPKFKAPAVRAVKYLVEAQGNLGGWRYQPKGDSDTSVTGWALMALQSARMSQLDVPPNTLERIGMFLDKMSADRGATYGYMQGSEHSDALTAEGLLCRQYLGWPQNDERIVKGADWLLQNHMPQPKARNVYYWYYGTQMFHHLEGPRWDKWNGTMRDMVIRLQRKSGNEAGSWDPETEGHGMDGGRLYTTCLSTFILEVYYRHLPLYSKIRL